MIRSTQSFDHKIWSDFKIGQLVQNEFNKMQLLEYTKLREYSEYLMNKNFQDIKTSLNKIRKSINGYSFYILNSTNNYIINLNLITHQIEIKRSI